MDSTWKNRGGTERRRQKMHTYLFAIAENLGFAPNFEQLH